MENAMTNNAEMTKDQTTKTSKSVKTKTAKTPEPKPDQVSAVKTKAPKQAKASKAGSETADRLPASIEELKASKSGPVCDLFLAGKDKEEIAKEFKASFNLSDTQAAKIIRWITGRVRFNRSLHGSLGKLRGRFYAVKHGKYPRETAKFSVFCQ
jgi:hypothetical protein